MLGSIRTKDSVNTIMQFERAKYQGRYSLLAGVEMQLDDARHEREFDSAIARLPLTHNFIEGLAALIDDASKPIQDLQLFFERFAKLNVSCSSPSGDARIGDLEFAKYSPIETSRKRSQERSGKLRIS